MYLVDKLFPDNGGQVQRQLGLLLPQGEAQQLADEGEPLQMLCEKNGASSVGGVASTI